MKGFCIMMILLACALGCALPSDQKQVLSKGNTAMTGPQSSLKPQPQMPLPRDPQIAVQEEFDVAKQQNSSAAWEMFLLRHPDNILATIARKNLNELRVKRPTSM